jgi:Protein tyrosine and serine/threonine kinase
MVQTGLKGGGNGAQVYMGVLNGVTNVAVKQLREGDQAMRDRFRQEISILRGLHSPHIVQFLGASIQVSPSKLFSKGSVGRQLCLKGN